MTIQNIATELMTMAESLKEKNSISSLDYVSLVNKIRDIKDYQDNSEHHRECLVLLPELGLNEENRPLVKISCKTLILKFECSHWMSINNDIENKGFHLIEDDDNHSFLYEGSHNCDSDILIDCNPVIVKIL